MGGTQAVLFKHTDLYSPTVQLNSPTESIPAAQFSLSSIYVTLKIH